MQQVRRPPEARSYTDVVFLPYDGYFGSTVDTLAQLRRLLEDGWSGLDLPAGVLGELVQAEGGVNVPRRAWVRGLAALCREFGTLLIVDDIQMGNGRAGTFFSFEPHDLVPDVVLLSKSIGGGLPLSVLLMTPSATSSGPIDIAGSRRAPLRQPAIDRAGVVALDAEPVAALSRQLERPHAVGRGHVPLRARADEAGPREVLPRGAGRLRDRCGARRELGNVVLDHQWT